MTLFTSQSSATFYGKLFDTLLNAFIVSAREGFGYVTDLWDYLNRVREYLTTLEDLPPVDYDSAGLSQ